ncbi:MAG: hypothetical protein M1308_14215 [Actinobacteria bacterium]|nr:hypothetical protein [Actinomycetota bacterium]
MLSVERVKKALNHLEPDRIPIDLGGTQTGIHRIAYENLLEYFGRKEEIKIIDANQQLAQVSEYVLKEMEIDTRYVIDPVEIDYKEVKKGFIGYKDIWGVVRGEKKGKEILYLNIIENPLKDAKEEDIDHYDWPDPINNKLFERTFNTAKTIKETTNYAVVSRTIGVIFEACWKMRGMDNFFMDLLVNRNFAEKLLDIMTEYQIKFCEGYLKSSGKYFDVIFTGDDIGMQGGPIISPKIYRELIKPRQKMIFDKIHELTDAKICYHTCGAVSEFINDFIEIGIDFLNPVQLSAANMDAKDLKDRFGNKIGFWGGGVDSQSVFPFGSPEQVEEDVKWRIDIFKKGGRFCF